MSKANHTQVSDSKDHETAFERRLADFLKKVKGKPRITVNDVKDIAWNGADVAIISRLAFMLMEQDPTLDIEEMTTIIQEAWNNFPHQSLNGLAPQDIADRFEQDKDFNFADRKDLFMIFKERFPDKTRIVRMRDNEWSCEHPASLLSERDQLRDRIEKVKQHEERSEDDENEEGEEEGDDFFNTTGALFAVIHVASMREALEREPLFFDAAIELAQGALEHNEIGYAQKVLTETHKHARELFPPDFVHGKDIMPWHFLGNRPFLSLLGEHAFMVQEIDGILASIPYYEELIALNPNDNQGVRGLLATAYLKTNKLKELCDLSEKYPDDIVAELAIGRLLALFKLGKEDEAKKEAKKMKKQWAHIFDEIIKSDHPQPKLHPGRVQVGGDDEAWLYWQEQGTFWMTTSAARDYLRELMMGGGKK